MSAGGGDRHPPHVRRFRRLREPQITRISADYSSSINRRLRRLAQIVLPEKGRALWKLWKTRPVRQRFPRCCGRVFASAASADSTGARTLLGADLDKHEPVLVLVLLQECGCFPVGDQAGSRASCVASILSCSSLAVDRSKPLPGVDRKPGRPYRLKPGRMRGREKEKSA